MKDPNDNQTIDSFSDDLPKKRRGRPPMGARALTPAEKQKAYRDRQRAKKQAEAKRLEAIRDGQQVKSDVIDLESSFPDVYRENANKRQ